MSKRNDLHPFVASHNFTESTRSHALESKTGRVAATVQNNRNDLQARDPAPSHNANPMQSQARSRVDLVVDLRSCAIDSRAGSLPRPQDPTHRHQYKKRFPHDRMLARKWQNVLDGVGRCCCVYTPGSISVVLVKICSNKTSVCLRRAYLPQSSQPLQVAGGVASASRPLYVCARTSDTTGGYFYSFSLAKKKGKSLRSGSGFKRTRRSVAGGRERIRLRSLVGDEALQLAPLAQPRPKEGQ